MKKFLTALQLVITLLMVLFLVVPVLMSMLAGVTDNYAHGWRSGLTLRWVQQVWELYHGAIGLSILIALATLAITLVVGVPAGYALSRSRNRLARWLEGLMVLPVAIPGLASALALLVMYGSLTAFRTSAWFIVVGHVIFTLPFMVRSVTAICLGCDLKTLEEGAASLGATFWQRFTTVVLPNIRPGILAGALTVVTLSIGEFNLTWMLHTPTTQTLPVGLADAYASMRLEIGSAYTLIFFVMIVPLLTVLQSVSKPTGQQRGQRTNRMKQDQTA
ncbi:ABC transporter permease [Andreprevotia chitinilytica]|uniref:ABC transporter permease n=1 Tax=Andreprevotia chitinilytica TaxID=396808 RepID=UPI0006916EC8|nr:ABC transporter permease [Andreprevotia chitinilytica]